MILCGLACGLGMLGGWRGIGEVEVEGVWMGWDGIALQGYLISRHGLDLVWFYYCISRFVLLHFIGVGNTRYTISIIKGIRRS